YVVSITNTDSIGCSFSSFTLQTTPPTASWQTSFGTSPVTMNAGATVSTTLKITSALTEPPGSYTIFATATSTTDSTLAGSAPMGYNIAAGPGDPGTPG